MNIECKVRKISPMKAILSYNSGKCNKKVIIAVAHYMIGKCKSIIDSSKDNHGEILVELTSFDKDIEEYIDEFNEEVNYYDFYQNMMLEKVRLRQLFLEEVLKLAKKKM